jgi:LuxR family glucitol operon transcriptional activator
LRKRWYGKFRIIANQPDQKSTMKKKNQQRNPVFGQLLKGMLSSITAFEHKKAWMIEQEVGELIGVEGRTVQNYKAGQIPTEAKTIRLLAELSVSRAYLNKRWLRWFLKEARYPAVDSLLQELFESSEEYAELSPVRHNLPAPSFTQFVERVKPFADIIEGLQQRSAVVLLVGPGGMGKTSLAHEVASRCVQRRAEMPNFDAVVWISDKDHPGSTTFATVLNEIAYILEYPGYIQLATSDKQRKVEEVLRKTRVLLVIDNIETVGDNALMRWLVRFPEPGKVLVTSRELSPMLRNSSWVVELRGMTDEEAYTLVRQRTHLLKLQDIISDAQEIAPLVMATGGCPKAIELGLGLIKYEQQSLRQMVETFSAAHHGLFDNLFSRAWSSLDQDAQHVFLAMSLFLGSASAEALAVTADVQGLAFDRSLERLIDLALVDVHQLDIHSLPRYALHPLVRVFAQARLAEHAAFEEQARKRWVCWYVEFTSGIGFTWDDSTMLRRLDSEHETVFAVIRWAASHQWHEETIRLARETEYYYYVRALWDRKLALHVMYAEAAQGLEDTQQEMIALSMHVQLLSRQGKVSEAETFLPRLNELATSSPLQEDEPFFFYHHALGLYHLARGELVDAQHEWQYILEHSAGLPSHMYIGTRQWLATCLYHQGLLEAAYQQYHEAREGAQQQGYTRYVNLIQLKLARIHIEQGEEEEAAALVARIYNSVQQGQDRELLAHTQYVRAHLYRLRGNREVAYAALLEAIELFERMGLTIETTAARHELNDLAA